MIATRTQRGTLLSLSMFLAVFSLPAQTTVLRVYADKRNNVHVVSPSGRENLIHRERGQVGIDSVKISSDKQTAGWLVLYPDPDADSPFAGKLVVWRDGRVLRTFSADQTFWSWSFEHAAEQVAYHTGPTHGEAASHCELRDIETGRLLASWDGDLESAGRPAWVKNLDH